MAQESIILSHLKTGPISSNEALHLYKIARLAAIVSRLRKRGYLIDTHYRTSSQGGRYGIYHLKTTQPEQESLL